MFPGRILGEGCVGSVGLLCLRAVPCLPQAIETNEKHLKEIETKLAPAVEKAAEGLKTGDKAKAVKDAMGESLKGYLDQIKQYKEAVAKQPAAHEQPLIDVMNVKEAFTHKRLQEDYVKAAEKFLSTAGGKGGNPAAAAGVGAAGKEGLGPEVRYFFPEYTPRSYF